MTQVYIPFYFEWADYLRQLPDAEYGKLIKAILDFAMGGEKARMPKVSPAAEMAYKFITSAICRSEAKRGGVTASEGEKSYTPPKKEKKTFKRVEKCAQEKEGKKDLSPTSTDKPDKNITSATTKEVKIRENKHKNTTNTQNKPQSESQSPTEAQKIAPTREQVRNFFKKRGFKSNPDEFFNFYESNGWRVGQNPMKNWQSSAENWELRVKRETKPQKAEEEPRRYGDFDVHEVFKLALERSYGDLNEEEEM